MVWAENLILFYLWLCAVVWCGVLYVITKSDPKGILDLHESYVDIKVPYFVRNMNNGLMGLLLIIMGYTATGIALCIGAFCLAVSRYAVDMVIERLMEELEVDYSELRKEITEE